MILPARNHHPAIERRRAGRGLLLAGGLSALVLAFLLLLRFAARERAPEAVTAALPARAVQGVATLPAAMPDPREAILAKAPLTPAPAPGLTETSTEGPLPVISADGREAWQVYARPFDRRDARPRLAIVISGLGLSDIATKEALADLPPNVTLSFLPSAGDTGRWLEEARAKGHETLLDLSLDAVEDSRQYVGAPALLTSLEASPDLGHLRWVMSRGTGYIGLATYMSTPFARSPEALRPMLEALKKRGLAFFDARTTEEKTARAVASELGLPRGFADRILDAELSPSDIGEALSGLEDLARHRGRAIGVGSAYPETIAAVARWAKGPHRVVLAPLSAVLAR